MLKKVLIIISFFLGITVGTLSTSALIYYNIFTSMSETMLRIIVTIGTTVVFVLMSLLFSDRFVAMLKRIEDRLSRTPIQKIVFTTIGLILGLLLASLLSSGVDVIAGAGIMGRIISAVIYIVFGYLGLVLGYRREGEFLNTLTAFKLGSKPKEKEAKVKTKKVIAKVVDTSALIDSRVQDVARTGFLEGKIIVPEFVLKELQLISDSEDPLKRAKGRLGLDCVEHLQKMKEIDLEIDNKYNYNEHKGVDNLLIDYALKYKCAIITTDYNLNKLATLQSIKVLNVNDLSNAVKPMLTTGEKLKVQVLREGKENNQGVAYTEDGTMIVVENGKRAVGKTVEVEVQSVLQTSSGRIISAVIYIVFGYLGLVLGYRREGEFLNILTAFKFGSKPKEKEAKVKTKKVVAKVVDTSALIDSRVQDVAKTGFLEGKIIVPEFVLKELQLISDSEDPLKRAKGRLGLDCVEHLQKMKEIDLEIDNKYNYNEHKGVDNLLIDYALKYKCAIITTDYNLNKLATLQSIKVLNVNDLSNAVKPMLTTGEKLKVQVLREGKENNQGVAYTEDGTMIVVENGKRAVGKTVEVEVQSVLQTSSGRIIFTRIV